MLEKIGQVFEVLIITLKCLDFILRSWENHTGFLYKRSSAWSELFEEDSSYYQGRRRESNLEAVEVTRQQKWPGYSVYDKELWGMFKGIEKTGLDNREGEYSKKDL